jgi:hypothetical protein
MAASPASSTDRRTWFWSSWAVSLLVHLLLVGGVVSLAGSHGVIPAEKEEVEQELVIHLAAEREPTPPLDPPAEAKGQPPAAAANDEPSPLRALETLSPAPAPPAGPITGLGPAISPRELDGALAPPKVQMPGVPGAVETKFFGTPAKGAKFVYVIDRSASMQQALAFAKSELLLSLQLLPPTAEYQVVYYDLRPRTLDLDGKTGLLLATTENKNRTAKLLDTIRSEGGTDHVRAIKRAFTLAPHVIYFLTDADELKPPQVQELTALNQRGSNARIHCIELNAGAASRTNAPMRQLARENRGEYRAINPATLGRP